MRSKLEVLLEDENFGVEAISYDTGLMLHHFNDIIEYLILETDGYFEVYLIYLMKMNLHIVT